METKRRSVAKQSKELQFSGFYVKANQTLLSSKLICCKLCGWLLILEFIIGSLKRVILHGYGHFIVICKSFLPHKNIGFISTCQ